MFGIVYTAAYLLTVAGVLAGIVYYIYKFSGSAEVKNYLDSYTDSLRDGMDFNTVVKNALKSYLILYICILTCSFFKLGKFVSAAVLLRKGFVSAFTAAAISDVYGFSGIALTAAVMPQTILMIPIMSAYCAAAFCFYENRENTDRRGKIIYIIFLIAVFTIFCGLAFSEGIITTTFAKWLAFKVT